MGYPYQNRWTHTPGTVSQMSLYQNSVGGEVSPKSVDVELYLKGGQWETLAITHQPSGIDVTGLKPPYL